MTRAADGHGVRQKKKIYLPRIKTLKDFRQNDVNTQENFRKEFSIKEKIPWTPYNVYLH